MAEYIEIGQMWQCGTCYHNGTHGCIIGLECDHGESYRPDYNKLKKADVTPVVHGKWVGQVIEVSDFDGDWLAMKYHCSLCGRVEYRKEPYCHCGAKMDE